MSIRASNGSSLTGLQGPEWRIRQQGVFWTESVVLKTEYSGIRGYYGKGNRPHRDDVQGSNADQEVLHQTLRLEVRTVRRQVHDVQNLQERRGRRLPARQEAQSRHNHTLRQRRPDTGDQAEGQGPRWTDSEEEKVHRRRNGLLGNHRRPARQRHRPLEQKVNRAYWSIGQQVTRYHSADYQTPF